MNTMAIFSSNLRLPSIYVHYIYHLVSAIWELDDKNFG